MDYEPDNIAVDQDGTRTFVTLQEANAIAVLDLTTNTFTEIIGLGAKDFSQAGNEIDPKDNDNVVLFRSVAAKGLYMPDGVATYQWRGQTYLVTADGEFREDNADRSAASTFGAVAPLDRLRVSNRDSLSGNLYAAGAPVFLHPSCRRRVWSTTAAAFSTGRLQPISFTTTAAAVTRAWNQKALQFCRWETGRMPSSGSSAQSRVLLRSSTSRISTQSVSSTPSSRSGNLSPEGMAA